MTWHRKPLKDVVDRCFRCGLCRAVCPAFLQDGREPAVARAKLQLIAALSGKEVPPSGRLAYLLSRCLTCGVCETICPADAAVTEAILRARGELVTALNLGTAGPGPANAGLKLGRPAGRAGPSVAGGTPPVVGARRPGRSDGERPSVEPIRGPLPDDAPTEVVLSRWRQYLQVLRSRPERPLAAVLGLLSGRPAEESPEPAHEAEASGQPRTIGPVDARRKVAYFPGCADLLWPRLWESTFELFQRAGVRAVVPSGTYCCGYPFLEAGDLAPARQLANENIRAFEKLEVEAIVTGCSAGGRMLGRYTGEILGLTGFPVPVYELGDFLTQLAGEGAFPELRNPVSARIAYLPPRGSGRPLEGAVELLGRVPQLEPVLLENDTGCGGSLFFAALHPRQHEQIMERMVEAVVDRGCRAVVAHSPLTMYLLDRYLESRQMDLRVIHLAEILAMACSGGPAEIGKALPNTTGG